MARNLSDYWRVDKCRDKVGELASILEGSQEAVELLGGKFKVMWSGQHATIHSKKTITLDPGILIGLNPPYPGQAVDVVIGAALHESGHEKWTEPMMGWETWESLSPAEQDELKDLHNLLEDAYIDSRLGRISNTLSEYIKAVRKALYPEWGKEAVRQLAEGEPSRDSLKQIVAAITLYGEEIPDTASEEVAKGLAEFLSRTLDYIREDSPSKRRDMAVDTWRWLQQYPAEDTSSITEQAKQLVSKEAINSDIDGGSQAKPEGEGKPEGDGQTVSKGQAGEEDGLPQEDNLPQEEGASTSPLQGEDNAPTEASEDEGDSDGDSDRDDGDDEGDEEDSPDSDGEPWEDLPTLSDDQVAEILQKNLWGGNEPGTLGDLSDYLDNPRKTSLSNKEGEELQEYIETQQEDFTRQLNEMGVRAGVTKIKNAYYNAPSHGRMKAMVQREVQQIHHIFSQLDIVEARWRHGLDNGKLDGRRLSKVGVGKTTVFRHRDLKDRPSLAVELVLDVSGSMSHQLHVVNGTACIFAEGLKALYPKVWCEVITYNGGSGWHHEVELTRLACSTMKLSLQSVWHGGGTPSGEAIASALILLSRRREQRKVIIHFTDGAPDSSSAVRQALELCEKDRVEVVTISVGTKQTYLYGEGKVEVIRNVSELPQAVMRMMRKIYR